MKEKIKGFSDPRLIGREVYVRDIKVVISSMPLGLRVSCAIGENQYIFDKDGRYFSSDLLPALSFTPYTVTINENGQVIINGYSDEIELEDENEPKVGDFGWFWDSPSKKYFRYSKLNLIKDGYFYCVDAYENFSKTCPEWIKEIVNK